MGPDMKLGQQSRRPIKMKGPKPNIIPQYLRDTVEYTNYKKLGKDMKEFLRTTDKKLKYFADAYSNNEEVPEPIADFYEARNCWFRRKAQEENTPEEIPQKEEIKGQ